MKKYIFTVTLLFITLIAAYPTIQDIRFINSGYSLDSKYLPQLIDFSQNHDIRIETLQNWIMAESSGRERAFNRISKDYGLCQLHDVNYLVGKYWNTDHQFDIWNGEHNLFIGLAYLSDLIKEFGTHYGFMAYNIGRGRVSRGNILKVGIEYVNRIIPIQAESIYKLPFIALDFRYVLIFREQILFDDRRQRV